MSENFDIRRATDILEKCAAIGMYPSPLPDSDETRIQEAERLVALAEQAEAVAQEVGADKVPNYEAIMEVIMLAKVDGGAPSAQTAKSGDGEGVASEPQQLPGEAKGSNVEPDAPSPPPETPEEPDPSPTAVGLQEDMQADSAQKTTGRWCDADGLVWVVDQDLGDELEVHMDGDPEKTTVPRDFLVRKIDDPAPAQEIEPEQEEEPSTSSQESQQQESSSSSERSAPRDGEGQTGSGAAASPSGTGSPPESRPPSQPSSSGVSSTGDGAYEDLLARVKADYDSAGLPIPRDVQSPPEMPQDLTANEAENRRLHSAFNACAGRVRYLLGLERQAKIGCQRLQKEAMKGPMRAARAELGAKATATEVTMLAEDDEQVVMWRGHAEKHADREAAYKDLFDVYSTNVEVLSRDYSMSGRELGQRN